MAREIDLMVPRCKCIADWPRNNKVKVGDILFFVPGDTGFQVGHYSDHIRGFPLGTLMVPGDVEPFPHLFKRLEWWEDREEYFWLDKSESRRPLFVSNIGKSVYGTAWAIDLSNGSFTLIVGDDNTKAHLSNYLPASEQEYNEYINSELPSSKKTASKSQP